MVIATLTVQQQWIAAKIDEQVGAYLLTNQTSLPTIGDTATATSLSYAQVAWALVYINTGKTFQASLLPESDADLATTTAVMGTWG